MILPSGIIIKGIGGFYYVKVNDTIYECKARGIFRKDGQSPLPGDRVSISITDESNKIGSLDEILPRDTQLVRPAVANVNQIAVVIAAKSPDPDLSLLDKLLITGDLKGMNSIICVNKIDLDTKKEYQNIVEAYEKAGYRVLLVSSVLGTGFDGLRDALHGKITVFAGQSGVGKSTILNRVMNSMVMQTGDISGKIERGKHTTRHAELVELEGGGYIVDTPGFSSFELTDIKYDELELYYPEFKDCLGKCKFTGCSHISEPGCSVKQTGVVDTGRYERYIQFYNLLKQIKGYEVKGKKN